MMIGSPEGIDLDLDPCVQRGMAWLNHDQPTWRDIIDVPTLDMRSVTRCIIGQAYYAASGAEFAGVMRRLVPAYLGGECGEPDPAIVAYLSATHRPDHLDVGTVFGFARTNDYAWDALQDLWTAYLVGA